MESNFQSATGFVENSFYPRYEGVPFGVPPQVYPYPVGGMQQVAQKMSSIPALADDIATNYDYKVVAAEPYGFILQPDLPAYSY